MGRGLDHAFETATPDVAATVRWLLDEGAAVTREVGSPNESFGNVLLELRLGDAVLLVTRDRGQWMLDLQIDDLPRRFDFDLVHAAMTGTDPISEWPTGKRLPDQLPPGVAWRPEVSKALDWLRSTPDAVAQLTLLGQQRGDRL